MNASCPDYYKISACEDLNHWAIRKLRSANWLSHAQGLLLSVLWVEMLHYVVRMPLKSPTALGVIAEIDKAVSLLQDMREALALDAEAAQEAPALDAASSLVMSCPDCHAPLRRLGDAAMSFGDYVCLTCPSNGREDTEHALWWRWEVLAAMGRAGRHEEKSL